MAKDKIEFELDGIEELKKRFTALDKEARKRVNRQVNVSAIELQREVRKSITSPTGRFRRYKRGKTQISKNKKRLHYSSLPGRPPNSDTGKLMGSIQVTRKASLTSSSAYVRAGGSGAKYAPFLDKGTRDMKARPYWRVMIRKKSPIFVGRIKQAIRGLL